MLRCDIHDIKLTLVTTERGYCKTCRQERDALQQLVSDGVKRTHAAPRAVQLLGLDGIVYALDDAGHVWRLEGAIENEKINVWWSQLPAFPPAAGSVERG